MKFLAGKSSVFALTVFGLAVASCGRVEDTDHATLLWEQSRTSTTRYAFLESRDLTDRFIFGASVIETKGFKSAALDMVIRPTEVTLATRSVGTTRRRVAVRAVADGSTIMSFDASQQGQRVEVDFASAGNDVRLVGLIERLGGIYTVSDQLGVWVSEGAPVVKQIQQDKDTLVVDLMHTVKQGKLNASETDVAQVEPGPPGDVTVRVYLRRKSAMGSIANIRTIEQGRDVNIGYFGSSLAEDTGPIQRFAVGQKPGVEELTFFLKDVPADFKDTATRAVTSWTKAFDGKVVVKVKDAPADMNAGDPRFNVVKWFDGLDKEVGWAGVAKMMSDPTSGVVFGGHLYLNGSTVIDGYRNNVDFTRDITSAVTPTVFEGTFGGATFDRDIGEKPVIPFVTELGRGFDSYMQGYYEETIAHEVGHVLGLRHNFRGTVNLENGESQSVMDYAPRANRASYIGPGSYDIAAIQWGYFGKNPTTKLGFCTDEQIELFVDCNQGDWGNPIDYVINGTLDGVKLLSESPIEAKDTSYISSMGGNFENLFKLIRLVDQVPAAERANVLVKAKAAYDLVFAAKPSESLTSDQAVIASKNLEALRKLAREKEAKSKARLASR
jgi:hypothetical protein